MNPRAAFEKGLRAARANLLPGLALQFLMLCFLTAYLLHDGTQAFLAKVGETKQEMGYGFSMLSCVLSGALFPEIMRILFFQKARPSRDNLRNFITSAPLWAFMGVVVDFFYRCQNDWFGTGNSFSIVFFKVLVDQTLYSPFVSNPIINGFLAFRAGGFSSPALAAVFSRNFVAEKMMPSQIAGWFIWIPGVSLVYFMPPLLQLPTAVLIQCFYVMLLTSLHQRGSAK